MASLQSVRDGVSLGELAAYHQRNSEAEHREIKAPELFFPQEATWVREKITQARVLSEGDDVCRKHFEAPFLLASAVAGSFFDVCTSLIEGTKHFVTAVINCDLDGFYQVGQDLLAASQSLFFSIIGVFIVAVSFFAPSAVLSWLAPEGFTSDTPEVAGLKAELARADEKGKAVDKQIAEMQWIMAGLHAQVDELEATTMRERNELLASHGDRDEVLRRALGERDQARARLRIVLELQQQLNSGRVDSDAAIDRHIQALSREIEEAFAEADAARREKAELLMALRSRLPGAHLEGDASAALLAEVDRIAAELQSWIEEFESVEETRRDRELLQTTLLREDGVKRERDGYRDRCARAESAERQAVARSEELGRSVVRLGQQVALTERRATRAEESLGQHQRRLASWEREFMSIPVVRERIAGLERKLASHTSAASVDAEEGDGRAELLAELEALRRQVAGVEQRVEIARTGATAQQAIAGEATERALRAEEELSVLRAKVEELSAAREMDGRVEAAISALETVFPREEMGAEADAIEEEGELRFDELARRAAAELMGLRMFKQQAGDLGELSEVRAKLEALEAQRVQLLDAQAVAARVVAAEEANVRLREEVAELRAAESRVATASHADASAERDIAERRAAAEATLAHLQLQIAEAQRALVAAISLKEQVMRMGTNPSPLARVMLAARGEGSAVSAHATSAVAASHAMVPSVKLRVERPLGYGGLVLPGVDVQRLLAEREGGLWGLVDPRLLACGFGSPRNQIAALLGFTRGPLSDGELVRRRPPLLLDAPSLGHLPDGVAAESAEALEGLLGAASATVVEMHTLPAPVAAAASGIEGYDEARQEGPEAVRAFLSEGRAQETRPSVQDMAAADDVIRSAGHTRAEVDGELKARPIRFVKGGDGGFCDLTSLADLERELGVTALGGSPAAIEKVFVLVQHHRDIGTALRSQALDLASARFASDTVAISWEGDHDTRRSLQVLKANAGVRLATTTRVDLVDRGTNEKIGRIKLFAVAVVRPNAGVQTGCQFTLEALD